MAGLVVPALLTGLVFALITWQFHGLNRPRPRFEQYAISAAVGVTGYVVLYALIEFFR